MHSFKLLKSGLLIPEKLQQALNPANATIANVEKLLQGLNVQFPIFDAAVKISKTSSEQPESSRTVSSVATSGEAASLDNATIVKLEESGVPSDLPLGPFIGDNTNSGIYLYNLRTSINPPQVS
jgi:hypothetical protein